MSNSSGGFCFLKEIQMFSPLIQNHIWVQQWNAYNASMIILLTPSFAMNVVINWNCPVRNVGKGIHLAANSAMDVAMI